MRNMSPFSIYLIIVFSFLLLFYSGRRWIDGADFVTQEQQKQIIEWVDMIQDCFYYLLEGDIDTAFLEYEEYRISTRYEK